MCKQKLVVCDIDGVLLTIPSWTGLEDFYTKLDECVPIEAGVRLVNGLNSPDVKIQFLTARDAKCRKYTEYQLKQLFDFPIHLDMRIQNDLRDDTVIKEEYLNQYLKEYDILCCIDDNPENCKMFKRHGLITLYMC